MCCQYGRSFHAPDETYNTALRAARTLERGRGSGHGRERRARIGADALDHRAEAVRALRREMFAQSHLFEQRDGVGRKNVLGVAACRNISRTGWRSARARYAHRCRRRRSAPGRPRRWDAPWCRARPGWRSPAPCWRRCGLPRQAAAAPARARSDSGSDRPNRRGREKLSMISSMSAIAPWSRVTLYIERGAGQVDVSSARLSDDGTAAAAG